MMRPHTRTQCTNANLCKECNPVTPAGGSPGPGPGSNGRPILVVELPAELIVKIISYLSFKEISQLRLVSSLTQAIIIP
jgi:hypothetical protein